MAVEIFDLNKISEGFPHLFLNTYPIAEPWLITLFILFTYAYIIKKTSIRKGLYASLPIFIFGPIILILIYGIENVYQQVGLLLLIYVASWVLATKIFAKTPMQ